MPRDLASSGVQSSSCASPGVGSASAGTAFSSPDAGPVGSCGNGLCKFKLPPPELPPASLLAWQLINRNDSKHRETEPFDLCRAAQRPPQQLDEQRQQ